MKKTALLLLLSLASISYAQDKTATDTIAEKPASEEGVEANIEFGFVGHINDDLNINQKLGSQGLPQINAFLPGFTVGWNAFDKKISTGTMFSFLYGSSSKDNHKLIYSGFDVKGYVHYNFLNKEKFALAGGLSIAFTGNYFYLYRKDNAIDMNNLTPDANPGQITFYNSMLYLGPSASAYFFKNTKHQLRLSAGYEFALTRGRYHSVNGELLNNIGEAGNNRFVFGVTIL